ncbi:MAG: ABC transporter ATP-binding protein [Lentisphaeria bacterium]
MPQDHSSQSPLLDIRNLSVEFSTDEGVLQAASNISFRLERGKVLGLVGESGCGKSVTAMSIPNLIPQPPGKIISGEIFFNGQDLQKLSLPELRKIRGKKIGVIFQEPMTALSPLHRIDKQLAEVCILHTNYNKEKIRALSLKWLHKVGLAAPERIMRAYPFELSGGMRQRVMIAMAMLLQPDLVIADEPTTALDVTIQAQILDLMRHLHRDTGGLLLITHDMGVIWEMCDDVAVMYASHLVEKAPVKELFAHPRHPYTQGLLQSIPGLQKNSNELHYIPGQVPSLLNPPPGCPFADRCPKVKPECRETMPEFIKVAENHYCACIQ